jgi:thioredoxin-like negative regulator of GroEL
MRRNSSHFGGQSQCFFAGLFLVLAATASHSADLQPEIEALQAFDQARTEINNQRYDRAEILLERVLMLHPENAEARIELAMLMARRGHNDGAQALVQSLLDDPRTEPDQFKALAALLQSMKKRAGQPGQPLCLGHP